MIIQKLHNNWRMRQVPEKNFLPAKVPGSVYNDLLLNGKSDLEGKFTIGC
jgi:beta-mannosidase